MSETFRVGDNVVFRTADGHLFDSLGMGQVVASDLSLVTVDLPIPGKPAARWTFNAGTLKFKSGELWWDEPRDFVIRHPTAPELEAFAEWGRMLEHSKRVSGLGSLLQSIDPGRLAEAQVDDIEAILNGQPRSCQTCTFWRPPYDDYGPGNCHNQTVRQLTAYGNETYPPPTLAEFGCNQWKAKEQPENGDDSDANG